MSLYQDINKRNLSFNTITKNILSKYVDKLNGIAAKLLNNPDAEIEWNYIDHIAGFQDLVSIHGLFKIELGETLFDVKSRTRVLITAENQNDYLKYLKIQVKASRLEVATVDELVEDIKDIQRLDSKITAAAEFQAMNISPKKKH